MSKIILKVFGSTLLFSIIVSSFVTTYFAGFSRGAHSTVEEFQKQVEEYLREEVSSISDEKEVEPTKSPATTKPKAVAPKVSVWGGPALWEAVNKRRVELGVNGLSSKEELCTIASIRLNQILETGKLDGHEGFSKLRDTRPDLKPIFDKYNLSEFLVAGATSPQNAVSLWENSMGHKQLLTGGQYVWGCIYAQAGFGVAIAAY